MAAKDILFYEGVQTKQEMIAIAEYEARADHGDIAMLLSIVRDEQLKPPPRATMIDFVNDSGWTPQVKAESAAIYINVDLKEYTITYDVVGLTQQQIDDGLVRMTKIDWT